MMMSYLAWNIQVCVFIILNLLSYVSMKGIDVTRHCSSSDQPFKQLFREDMSWKEYLHGLYEIDTSNNHDEIRRLTKHLLSNIESVIYYRYGDVDIKLVQLGYPNWRMTNLDQSLQAFAMDPHYQESRRGTSTILYPSYSWVEVNHFASNFFGSVGIFPYNEGYSTGYIYTAYIGNYSYVPYGCWFHVMKGTGVFINIGKTLAIANTTELLSYLGLNSQGCIEGVDCNGLPYVDKYLCTKALELNYDSIQLSSDFINEVIMCSGDCAEVPVNSSCPNVPMLGGFNHSKPCYCNDTCSLMNCGVDYGRPEFYDGIPEHMIDMNRHFTCIREKYLDVIEAFEEKEYEFKFAFTSNIIKYLSLHQITSTTAAKRNYDSNDQSNPRSPFIEHDSNDESNARSPFSEHDIEVALNRIANEYHLLLDISHSTTYHSSSPSDQDNHLTNSLGYTLLPYYNNLHPNLKPLRKKYLHGIANDSTRMTVDGDASSDRSRRNQSRKRRRTSSLRRRTSSHHRSRVDEHGSTASTDALEVAITSSSLLMGSMKVGILSIVSTDDWLMDLSLKEVEQLYMREPEFSRWIIDEAMCLRNQEANVIILISKASFNLNKHIFEKAHGFVDIIIGSNPYLTHRSSCNGQYHSFATNSSEYWMNGLIQVQYDVH